MARIRPSGLPIQRSREPWGQSRVGGTERAVSEADTPAVTLTYTTFSIVPVTLLTLVRVSPSRALHIWS